MANRIKVIGDYQDNISSGVKTSASNVKKQSDEIEKSNSKLKKSFDSVFSTDVVKSFSDTIKSEIKSSADEMGKSFKKQQGSISKFIGGVAGIGVSLLKAKIAMMLFSKVLTIFANNAVKFGGKGGPLSLISQGFVSLYRRLYKGGPVARGFAAVMRNSLVHSLNRTKESSKALSNSLEVFLGRLPIAGNLFRNLSNRASSAAKTIKSTGDSVKKSAANFDRLSGKALKATGSFVKLITKAKILVPALIAVVAAFVSFKIILGIVKDVARLGDEIDKLSQRISFSGEAAQKWARVLRLSGTSIQEVETGMARFQKNIVEASLGFGQARDAVKALGLETRKANGDFKSNEQLFNETVLTLADMRDKTLRNALAMQLFGRSGAKLVPVLNNGSEAIKEMLQESEKFVVITGEAQQASALFVDIGADLGDMFKKMKVDIAVHSMNLLSNVMQTMTTSPIVAFIGSLAKQLGVVLAGAIAAVLKSFQLLDLSVRGVILALKGMFTLLVGGINRLVKMMPDKLVPKGWKKSLQDFTDYLNTDFLKAVDDASEATSLLFSLKPTQKNRRGPRGIEIDQNDLDKTPGPGEAGLSGVKQLMSEFRRIGKSERQKELMDLTDWYDEQKKLVKKGLVDINVLTAVYKEREEAIIEKWNNKILDEELNAIEKQMKAQEAQRQKMLKAKEFFKSVEIQGMNSESSRRLAEINDENKKALDLAKEHAKNLKLTKEETEEKLLEVDRVYALKRRELRDEEQQKRKENMESIADFAVDAIGRAAGIMSTINDHRLSLIDEEEARRIKAVKSNVRSSKMQEKLITKVQEQSAEKRNSIRKQELMGSLAMAIANTAQGVTKMLASQGVLGIITGGLVSTAGAVQAGIITNQISKLASGGIIGGTGNKDSEPAMLTPGEMVLNREQQARLFNMANGRSQGLGQSQIVFNENITVNGNLDMEAAKDINNAREKQLNKLKEDLEELKFRGQMVGA